jgi:hypothetical protein
MCYEILIGKLVTNPCPGLSILPMNQCIFSSDRVYRYVLQCRCNDGTPESTSNLVVAGCNSERTLGFWHNSRKKPLSRTTTRTRTKRIASPRKIVWIGLNPSTADEVTLDQTLATVSRYSRNWGFSEVVMLNLFAFRATDPRDLKQATDPIGPDNDKHLLAEVSQADRVIACWGDHGKFLGRNRQVSDLLAVSFECLLKNRTGAPHHPLYLKSRIKPKPFGLDQIRN